MAVTIRHLNDDASFFLLFEPLEMEHPTIGGSAGPFCVLLDPWITGPSTIFHSSISTTTHCNPACVSSLQELPEPHLVIISQQMSDHCHEETLRQLLPSKTKTIILAEPASARLIRGWNYFDEDKVQVVPKWTAGTSGVVRIPVPPLIEGGRPGEVTVAFISQRHDLLGLHNAIGITYRPPPAHTSSSYQSAPIVSTTPTAISSGRPGSHSTQCCVQNAALPQSETTTTEAIRMPQSPTSPGLSSLYSVLSADSLPLSDISNGTNVTVATSVNPQEIFPAWSSCSSDGRRPAMSIIFSPHGIVYDNIHDYVTNHLIPEEALPLTALLHCFDNVSNPWWLGGSVLLGAPTGAEIATRLGAKVWISAHDGEKHVRGLATGWLRTRKWRREEVIDKLLADSGDGTQDSPSWKTGEVVPSGRNADGDKTTNFTKSRQRKRTEVIVLAAGEEVLVTSKGASSSYSLHKPNHCGLVSV
ncbi:hypothetical protein VTK73DRAFT_7264 [Phialemonium thermophilum]|uniref:Metallo-beta-lactamase domain-containing protein n=1 Tax=Phialemonium thermophilum TaxID=223376 RepID=A0ABR3XT20_9PEZI